MLPPLKSGQFALTSYPMQHRAPGEGDLVVEPGEEGCIEVEVTYDNLMEATEQYGLELEDSLEDDDMVPVWIISDPELAQRVKESDSNSVFLKSKHTWGRTIQVYPGQVGSTAENTGRGQKSL